MAANPIQRPVLPLQLEASTAKGCTDLCCRGQLIAATAEFFRTEAGRRIDRSIIFAVDVAGLNYLTGSGLRVLFSVISSVRKACCEFQLLKPRIV